MGAIRQPGTTSEAAACPFLHRVRTGVRWRDPPERFGPWKTVYERHRLWSADETWEPLLQQVQAAAHAAGEIGWDVSVDSTNTPVCVARHLLAEP